MNRFSLISAEWTEVVIGEPPLEIKVLVVADGILTFGEFSDFSLLRFCTVLAETKSAWEKIIVKTAHRKPGTETKAEISGFKFDTLDADGLPSLHIEHYDQVWLFGQDRVEFRLDDAELAVIKEFMNHGGGIFATGDHEDLGGGLCGAIPRVRAMRRWHIKDLGPGERAAPNRNNSTRIDTLREGLDPGFQKADEKDAIPQEIRPKFFVNATRTAVEPHELLARGAFAITILPDHMHEGECVGVEEIKKRAAQDPTVAAEFPVGINGETVWPEVVAIASSAGGSLLPGEHIFPVDPRCYIVISAYDGHLIGYKEGTVDYTFGRIVVDASFHHFVSSNLNGFLNNDGSPKKEFGIFAEYYHNTLHYLLPSEKKRRYFLRLLRALRFSDPLQEDLQDLSADNWDDVVYAGTRTKEVITKTFSAALARRCALSMISTVKPNLRTWIEDMINLWQKNNKEEASLFFLNSDAIVIVLLGQAILELTASLPSNIFEVSSRLSALVANSTPLHELLAEKIELRVGQLQERVGMLGQHLTQFSRIEALKEDAMGKCQTAANEKWVSSINDKEEGSFTIEPENGAFKGVFNDGVKFTGNCRPPKSGKRGKIQFTTEDHRTYVGVFEDDTNIQGLRLRGIGVDDVDGGDEDWVAVKTTT